MQLKVLGSSSAGNCYAIDDFMIECGLPMKKIIKGVERLPEFCLISHSHQDHCRAARELEKLGVKILCSEKTAQEIGLYNPIILENLKFFEFGKYSIKPFVLPHDVENFGFVVFTPEDVIFFATDCGNIPYLFPYAFTEILIESNYSDKIIDESNIDDLAKNRIKRDHFSLKQAVEFLNSCNLKKVNKIRLIHLSNRNSDEQYFIDIIQKKTGKICEVL
jgi:phosphoribosyl 1,2-cyclic phosphodiesterase